MAVLVEQRYPNKDHRLFRLSVANLHGVEWLPLTR